MKKILLGLTAFAVVALLGVASAGASMLPKTTWQVYTTATDYLVVHETDSPYSPICWEGKAHVENEAGLIVNAYQGQCTR